MKRLNPKDAANTGGACRNRHSLEASNLFFRSADRTQADSVKQQGYQDGRISREKLDRLFDPTSCISDNRSNLLEYDPAAMVQMQIAQFKKARRLPRVELGD